MKFIKLTFVSGEPVFINAPSIKVFYKYKNKTLIYTGEDENESLEVKETPEEIIALIEEIKT